MAYIEFEIYFQVEKCVAVEITNTLSLLQTTKSGTIGEVAKFYEKDRFVEASIGEFYDLLENNVAGDQDMLLVAERLLAATFFSQNFGEYGDE